jgi:hypothetical protein
MPTPPRKYPYNFIYKDGSYMTFYLTRQDYQKLVEYKLKDRSVVDLSLGILDISDIRSVVEQKIPEKPKNENTDEAENESFSKLFNLPYTDPETDEWLKEKLKNIWEGEH